MSFKTLVHRIYHELLSLKNKLQFVIKLDSGFNIHVPVHIEMSPLEGLVAQGTPSEVLEMKAN